MSQTDLTDSPDVKIGLVDELTTKSSKSISYSQVPKNRSLIDAE